MIKRQKLWSYALAGALAVSNLSAVAFPITALAGEEGFTITYDVNGGTPDIESTITTEAGVFTTASLDGITKTGYTSDGYRVTATDFLADVTATDTKVAADTEYTAKKSGTLTVAWKPDTINLAYNLQGGTAGKVQPTTKTYAANLENAISDPTKTKGIFAGWDLNGDLKDVEIDPSAEAAAQSSAIDERYATAGGPVTLTAVWIDEYTISYDANGGEGTIESQTFSKKISSITLRSSTGLTRKGYTPVGWSTVKGRTAEAWSTTTNPKTDFAFEGTTFSTSTTSDVTMYAIWGAKNEYTLTFDPDGGTGSIDPINVYAGENAKLPKNTFKKEGYKLTTGEEWIDEEETPHANEEEINGVTADATFTSNWVGIDYTIKFDKNGASEGDAPGVINTKYGKAEELPTKGSMKLGESEFLGWSADANGKLILAPGTEVENLTTTDGATITYYAIWEEPEDSFSVYYEANGGEGSITPELGVTLPHTIKANTFTREHYDFKGWATSPEATEAEYDAGDKIVTSSSTRITLYAVWEGVPATVYFDPNEGSGTMPAQKFVYGTPQAIAANTFVRENYNFIGWADAAEIVETTNTYEDGEEVDNFVGPKVVLYAQWAPIDADATEEAQEALDKANAANDAATKALETAQAAAKKANDAAKAADANATADTVKAAQDAAKAATDAAKAAEDAVKAADAASTALAEAIEVEGVDEEVVNSAIATIAEEVDIEMGSAETIKAAKDAASTATTAATNAQAKIDKADEEKKSDGSAAGTPAPVGNELKDADGNATGFVVTNATAGAAEAEYKGLEADKSAKKVTIPNEVKDHSGNTYKVTSIAANALKNAKGKEIVINKNIKKIGKNAMKGAKFTKITIKTDKKGKLSIGKNALKTSKKATIKVKGAKGAAKDKLAKKIKKQANKDSVVK